MCHMTETLFCWTDFLSLVVSDWMAIVYSLKPLTTSLKLMMCNTLLLSGDMQPDTIIDRRHFPVCFNTKFANLKFFSSQYQCFPLLAVYWMLHSLLKRTFIQSFTVYNLFLTKVGSNLYMFFNKKMFLNLMSTYQILLVFDLLNYIFHFHFEMNKEVSVFLLIFYRFSSWSA